MAKTKTAAVFSKRVKKTRKRNAYTSWRIKPSTIHVSKGDKVRFSPKTLVLLWFRKRNLFGTQLVTVPKSGKTLTVQTNEHGRYPYRVCCIEKGRFAYGSEPEMIVP